MYGSNRQPQPHHKPFDGFVIKFLSILHGKMILQTFIYQNVKTVIEFVKSI